MQRKRGELVPIGEVVSGLDDVLVPAIPSASPQTRHSFTVADQVNQLVAASEADPDLGFMARMMVLCSLPRSNPGNRKEYKRRNGPYTLVMTAIGDNKLPFAASTGGYHLSSENVLPPRAASPDYARDLNSSEIWAQKKGRSPLI